MDEITNLVTNIVKFAGDTILGTVLYDKLSGIFIKDNDKASFRNYVEKPDDEALQEEFRKALTERLSASEEAISEIKKVLETSDEPRLVKIKKILIADKIIRIDKNNGTININ